MPTRCITTPLFTLTVTEQDGAVVSARFAADNDSELCCADDTPLLRQAEQELLCYASGTLTRFTVPLSPAGTAFMKSVWAQLQDIPYGLTRTYGEVATLCGNPRAARAVGSACNRNPIAVLIPCHRVVGSNGALTGFAAGLDTKDRLLRLEQEGRPQ